MPTDLIYPDGPDDHEGIRTYNDAITQRNGTWHRIRERDGFRNILYYRGHQWITYDQGLQTYRPIGKLSSGAIKPVTNKIAPLVNQGVSNLVAFKPPLTYTPATDAPNDVAAATVADQVNTVIEKETQIRLLKPHIAKWLRLTGEVFLINSYNTSTDTGTLFIQSEKCTTCQAVATPLQIDQNGGMCPSCGSPEQPMQMDEAGMPMPPGPRFGPAMDEGGQPLGETYPRGKHLTEIETVFTVWYDPLAGTLEDSPYFRITHARNKDWVVRTYGPEFAEQVQYGLYGDAHSRYLTALAYATVGGLPSSTGLGPATENQVPVHRLWLQPRSDKAPKGIYAVIVGDKVAEAQEYPYHDEQGRPFLNVVHLGEDQVPGQISYKSRVDDLIPLQDLRNQLQSMMMLHSTRMANSVWVVPESVGVSKFSGEMGWVMRYQAMAGVPAPQRMAGDQLSPHFFKWLEIIDADMDALYGIFEVGKGESPFKGAAYATVQLLDERQQQGQSTLMENWAVGFMNWSRQHLNIWREYADEERTASLGYGKWSVAKFNKAALQGGVDLDVELGQNRPHSQVAKRAVIEQMVRLAVVNPFDPQEKFTLATALGMPEVIPDYKADSDKAARVVDQLAHGLPAPDPMPWDNHPIYLAALRRFMLSEEFDQMDPQQRAPILMRAMYHYQMMREAMMTAQAGPGQIAPKGPGGGGKGTAKEQPDTEDDVLERETQGASPETMTGGIAGAPSAMGA